MVSLGQSDMVDEWQFPTDSVCPPEPDDDDDEFARQKSNNLAGRRVFLVPAIEGAGFGGVARLKAILSPFGV